MAERQSKQISKLKIARTQVAAFFLLLLGVGFLFGFATGRISAPEQAQSVMVEAVTTSIESTVSAYIEAPIVYYNVPLSQELQEYIILLCEKEEVPASLVMAMIEQESAFSTDIVSETNDYGLMQINEVNHEWLSDRYGVTDFLDPYQNVYCGVSLIGGYLREHEDIGKALMCYNMGEYGAIKLWGKGVNSTYYSRMILAKTTEYEEEN